MTVEKRPRVGRRLGFTGRVGDGGCVSFMRESGNTKHQTPSTKKPSNSKRRNLHGAFYNGHLGEYRVISRNAILRFGA